MNKKEIGVCFEEEKALQNTLLTMHVHTHREVMSILHTYLIRFRS